MNNKILPYIYAFTCLCCAYAFIAIAHETKIGIMPELQKINNRITTLNADVQRQNEVYSAMFAGWEKLNSKSYANPGK